MTKDKNQAELPLEEAKGTETRSHEMVYKNGKFVKVIKVTETKVEVSYKEVELEFDDVQKAHNVKVGKVLWKAREKAKHTQKKVAKFIGITDSKICQVEKGNATLSILHLFMLATALHFDAFELLPGWEEKKTDTILKNELAKVKNVKN